MKIQIVTEYHRVTVNYGNNLQAYALNAYLRKVHPETTVNTLYFARDYKRKYVSAKFFLEKVAVKLQKLVQNKRNESVLDKGILQDRLRGFNEFQANYIEPYVMEMTWHQFIYTDADVLIVGSDVVWAQSKGVINRIKFLDVSSAQGRKISYAASFGENCIPDENKNTIRKFLSGFSAISVREKSSILLLKEIGIKNVSHTIDPVFLLTQNDWVKLEQKPKDIPDNAQFIFVYMLGANDQLLHSIQQLCSRMSFQIATVPYPSGVDEVDWSDFGDYKLLDCSPQEWLWCIHHASFVITDSFHGVAFSTIFHNRFLVIHRNYIRDLNIRLTDFLETIQQRNKFVHLEELEFTDLSNLVWNFPKIDRIVDEWRRQSMHFLETAFANV